jgi:hypothetical protein
MIRRPSQGNDRQPMIDRLLVLLLGGCALFAAVIFSELNRDDTGAPAAAPARARADAAAAPAAPSQRRDDLLATILARPLFSATRRPPDRATGDHPSDLDLANLRLTGIVIERSRHLALFAVKGAKPLTLTVGESLNEWRVESIDPRAVSLTGPDGTRVLQPESDKNLVRPKPPAPPRPAANPQPGPSAKPPGPVAAAPPPRPPSAAPPQPPAIPPQADGHRSKRQ